MQSRWCALAFVVLAGVPAVAATEGAGLYILQSNDMDPTTPTSQMDGRWNHWLAVDPAVTHLDTAIAIDGGGYAGRGQRIEVRERAPVAAIQVKIKRIGEPGALRWEAGTAWGRDDLGKGTVPAGAVNPNYEHFVTFRLRPARPAAVFLRLRAASGRCPDDYYAVYCTWRQQHPGTIDFHGYYGQRKLGMLYRMLRPDPNGEALGADGKPLPEGPSMMARLLTKEPGPGRRQLQADEEEPYSFVDDLAAGRDPRRAGLPWPGLRPDPGDVILKRGWRIVVAAPRSPQVETAVRDLQAFLRDSLLVRMPVAWSPGAAPGPRAITLTQGYGSVGEWGSGRAGEGESRKVGRSVRAAILAPAGHVAASLRRRVALSPRRRVSPSPIPPLSHSPTLRPAGYRFAAGSDRVTIRAKDAAGLLRGMWYLEDLLMLRGGPFLKPDQRVREPRCRPRMVAAAWGVQGALATTAPVYTDAHLSLISHYGHDAIWVIWRPGMEPEGRLPTRIAPGRLPEGTSHTPYNGRLRDLIERAARYDLEVVVQYSARHPAGDADKRLLQVEARRFLRDVPKLRTVILLDEAMGDSWIGLDPWIETCRVISDAFYQVRPDLQVAAWVYTFHAAAPTRQAADALMSRFFRLDRRVGLMYNFDSYWARRRDGTLQPAYDYCLSLKAPSEDFRLCAATLLEEAKRDGKPPRRLWAKIESRFSQESNTQPEIPCMQRWMERYEAVNDFGPPRIAGTWANYFHQGFFPTPVTELYGWLSYTNPPPAEDLLRAIARRDLGPGQEAQVLAAWRDFSEAIWHYPFYYGLSYTMNAGFAQPLWLNPAEPSPRPWRRGFANSLETMQLSAVGQGAGSGPENRARLAELQRHWNAGLAKLAKARAAAPPYARERAESNWRTAQSFGHKADVTLRFVRWLDARSRLYAPKGPEDAQSAVAELEKAGREELAAVKAALPMYRRDSRLGHLNHGRGCFTPLTIEWKVGLLEKALAEELPRLREAARQVQPLKGDLDRAAVERDWEVLAAGNATHRWGDGVLALSSPQVASGIMLATRRALRLPLRLSFTVSTGVVNGGSTFCIMGVPPKPGPNDEVHRGRLTFLVLKPGSWYHKLTPDRIAAEGKWADPLTLQPGGAPHRFSLDLTRTEAALAIDGKEVLRGAVSLPAEVYAYLAPDAYTNYDAGTLYLYELQAGEGVP